MSPSYEQNKKHIYKYRETHAETFRAYNNAYCKKYNEENRERLNKIRLGQYHYKKQCLIFRNILLSGEDSPEPPKNNIE
jgi:hypothetical protein